LRIAGFAALHNFPAGSIDGNYWGPAITTLKTVLRTPYFFSFHDKDLGHSLVLGEKGSGKTTIVNFLLSEARKFNNRIFYFDSNNSSKAFIEGILGDYHVLTKNINDKEFLQINPFSLPKNEENAAFLANWIKELIVFLKGDVAESETMLIPEIINQALSNQSPTFLTAFDLFSDKTKTPALYEKLKIWGSGKLGYIFGSQNECDWKNQVHGFNLDEIISQKPVLIPVVSYLLQKIDSLIDNSAPAIIIFDDAWELLDNEIIAAKLNDFLQKMRKKNCVVIFISNDKEEIAESKISKIINDNIATQIYLANKEPGQHCKTIFGLSEEELDVLKMMEIEDYNFLLKQRGESVIIDLDLRKSLNQKLKILSSDNFTLTALAEIISHLKEDNPEKKPTAQDWLAPISEVIKTIEKEKRDAEIKAAIEAKKAKAKKLEEE